MLESSVSCISTRRIQKKRPGGVQATEAVHLERASALCARSV